MSWGKGPVEENCTGHSGIRKQRVRIKAESEKVKGKQVRFIFPGHASSDAPPPATPVGQQLQPSQSLQTRMDQSGHSSRNLIISLLHVFALRKTPHIQTVTLTLRFQYTQSLSLLLQLKSCHDHGTLSSIRVS